MQFGPRQKRRLFGKRKGHRETGEMSLQITSMADIFTILLVFLLKGIATDAMQISPSNGTQLPEGTHTSVLNDEALQIEISRDGILIEKDFIVGLDHFRVPAS